MDESRLSILLQNVSDGSLSVENALSQLRGLPYEAVGDFATLDHHRALRSGFPETIYCESKTPEQVAAIAERLAERSPRLLGTRASRAHFDAAQERVADLRWHELARCLWVDREPDAARSEGVVLICAGTSDLPVLEEAALTLGRGRWEVFRRVTLPLSRRMLLVGLAQYSTQPSSSSNAISPFAPLPHSNFAPHHCVQLGTRCSRISTWSSRPSAASMSSTSSRCASSGPSTEIGSGTSPRSSRRPTQTGGGS